MHQVKHLELYSSVLPEIAPRTLAQAGRFISKSGGANEESVVNCLNSAFESAVNMGASDIHLDFDEIDGLEIRIRRAGMLEVLAGKLSPVESMLAKTKICAKANLDDNERLVPLDGRMMVFFGDRRVDVRVALLPTVSGYKMVCRLLDSSNANASPDALEIPYLVRETMKRVVSAPEGMVLMSGPVGSGKTTTLYSLLRYLNNDTRHIVTIENPVEYAVKSFTQIDVDGNMTFSRAMRASLRLDPDVIMVGEIRDEESAQIAQKAGTSGHMVLSTLHANSAAETITRLGEFGLQGFSISSVISAVIAQRLVRKFGDDCEIKWAPPNEVQQEWLSKRNLYFKEQLFPIITKGELSKSKRIPLVELIEITPEIRAVLEGSIHESNWITQIVNIASLQPQYETLAQAGVRIALEGKITLAEVIDATKDSAEIPAKIRWDQVLVLSGQVKVDKMEEVRLQIQQARAQGVLIELQDQLINSNACSTESILAAMRSPNVHKSHLDPHLISLPRIPRHSTA